MSGINNPAFDEDDRLHRHSLHLPLELKENIIDIPKNHCNGRRSIKDEEANALDESHGCLENCHNALGNFIFRNRKFFKILGLVFLNLTVFVYFAFASIYWTKHSPDCNFDWCDGYGMLLLLIALTYAGLLYYYVIKKYFGKSIIRLCRPFARCNERLQSTKYGSYVSQAAIYLTILAAVIVFLIFDTVNSRGRLISAIGIVILMSLGWIFSKHPGRINWKPVIWGLILQFCLGLITIRWAIGRLIFQCISNKVANFLNYARDGAIFIFSAELVEKQIFAFSVLPVIFFFSFVIQILYYLGTMQWVIMKLGWVLQSVMGTTLCESINCAANTFIGMTESPLLIKPYISKLTSSELHAIMCSGFATVSGTVFAAYIGFGAQPAHLLTASLMSAPAALCYSKLFYPETEKSLTCLKNIKLEKSEDSSILDAATKGAVAAIPIVLGIIASIVAFVSFISFINGILGWLGALVGYEALSFELILSKVFIPLSYIMGVPWEDCEKVATLIGLKTVINEFIAYQKLGEYKKAGLLSGRTEAIATYAICGFSNPGSIAIMIGALSAMAPEKREQITSVTMRAFIAGSTVCFLTASIAGMLMNDDFFDNMVSSNFTTTTIAVTA